LRFPPRALSVGRMTGNGVLPVPTIAERGRLGWRKAAGHNRRALAEAAMSRYKRVIGDALRSRTDRRRATEVAIAVEVLNRMLELGRPEFVRIA